MANKNKSKAHYIHKMPHSMQERLVGFFIICGISLLFIALVLSKSISELFVDKFTLYAFLQNAQGISPDTQVFVSGVKAGKVSDIHITDSLKIRIELTLESRFREFIRLDSYALFHRSGFLSSSFIEIAGGDKSRPLVEDKSIIKLKEKPTLEDGLQKAADTMELLKDTVAHINQITKKLDVNVAHNTLSEIMHSATALRGSMESINNQSGIVGKLIHDHQTKTQVASIITRFDKLLDQSNASLEQLQPVIANVAKVSDQLSVSAAQLPAWIAQTSELAQQANEAAKNLPGLILQISKLIQRGEASVSQLPKLVKNTEVAVQQFLRVLSQLNERLEDLPAITNATQDTLDEATRTLRSIRNTWPISAGSSQESKTPKDFSPLAPID